MTCFYPVKAYMPINKANDGKRRLSFTVPPNILDYSRIDVPCGKCIGCRLEYARQWAMRGLLESRMYSDNVFVTLTYDDQHLPSDFSLCKREMQLFMKKLRVAFSRGVVFKDRSGKEHIFKRDGIRFMLSGEYGEHTNRPHYHLILFNCDFPDKVLFSKSGENRLYNSDILSSIWNKGHAVIGNVSFESIGYVARYITKKVTGELADKHYQYVDNKSGKIFIRIPEFFLMSRKPGIGKTWFDKYGLSDIYSSPDKDCIHIRGMPMFPPRYFDNLLNQSDSELIELFKSKRKEKSVLFEHERTRKRLDVRELCLKAKLNFFGMLDRVL